MSEESASKTVTGPLDDHHACMRVVADVEACLDDHPDREGKWSGRLTEALTRLSTTLRSHFESEEQEPLFRTIPATHPRFAGRLARLEAEHAKILEVLDAVMYKAKDLTSDRIYDQRELNGHVQQLIAKIRRHEAEENEILIEAHWDEVGVGD